MFYEITSKFYVQANSIEEAEEKAYTVLLDDGVFDIEVSVK